MRRKQGAVAARRLLAHFTIGFVCALMSAAAAERSLAYSAIARWQSTAEGGGGAWGDGLTLTWSIVPDGTVIPAIYILQGERTSPSDLVAQLDATFGAGAASGDLTARPWFRFLSNALGRWGELSGLDFAYEPADDGVRILEVNVGATGVRGDIRIGGHFIDGDPRNPDGSPAGNILGYGFFPQHGDFVLDASNLPLFDDPTGDYLVLRNTLMHEFGHTLGLAHVEGDADPETPGPQAGTLLMEPSLTTAFDGPQLDDILGIQQLYGDQFEKQAGNDVPLLATPLGLVVSGQPAVVGADGDSVRVEPDEIDFVSIDANSDLDLFSFSIGDAAAVDVSLTPMGAPYQLVGVDGEPLSVDPRRVGDLSFDVLASDAQTVLASLDATGLGEGELASGLQLDEPGEYFIRVAAATATPQLYRLDVAIAVPEAACSALALTALATATVLRRSSGTQRG